MALSKQPSIDVASYTLPKWFKQNVGTQVQECQNYDIWCLRVLENHELKSSHTLQQFFLHFQETQQGIQPRTFRPEVNRTTNQSMRKILGP